MKARLGIVIVFSAGAWLGLSPLIGTNAKALGDPLTATNALAASAFSVGEGEQTPTYIGSKKCKMCHIRQYKSWAKTKMGNALDILKPGHSAGAKKAYGVDPEKDYTADATCLACHTTGYGHEGGYSVPDPNDKKSVKRAKYLTHVGCESCHGPGSEYIKVFREIFRSKRKYKVEELYAAGLHKMSVSVCTECHNERSPTINAGDPFDFEQKKKEGTHEHFPLKQRS